MAQAKDMGRYWGGWMERCANRGTAEGKGALPICSLGGAHKMITLSEQGLYFFLGRSDKPAALSFQKWIARDAIPSLQGRYSMSAPKSLTEALMALLRRKRHPHRGAA
jgi:prophage antirepressor-like protein